MGADHTRHHIEDVKEATKCQDGGPLSLKDRQAAGLNRLVRPARFSYLCNPENGLKMEHIGPGDAEWEATIKKGGPTSELPTGHYTEPHE
jgi:hypothetical protein